ncbi:tRNA (adenosine(37)-N6)-threonylcarbamoyltransferase complex ATPase subunit type 1 TsaE [Lipingzhangella sp. LS1_29]|uniref:tRNA threonylcarbamoyladenosine biosynthesis protein TsaE n=1 Tax=Lipingzhangella rawalii TaxID=2055835 RepID=A0ABU2H559_9ACTN|nr:tRNA (adenosine(37)-N6)-threonylcarbamoyltransferase complex ATPase subunit type 1 TsaE [Lipingzhangella rawalii]MDS1269994.1 tRNA (adenosine(37)-N6)-threonylcarbamoyltransferase complex ATPase subunit type 1 TsaE [Lipingzhangella rawalii]
MTDTTSQVTMPALAITASTDPEMRTVGRELATQLRAGDLLVLSGPLGAGKTTLTQGLADGLRVRGPITSPTFVLSRIHPSLCGGPSLVHVDAYRLTDAAELDDLDLDTSLPEAVTVVEWGSGIADGLTDTPLEVTIDRHSDDTRTVYLSGHASRWSHVLDELGN